jgi:hypothetical protein
VSGLHYGLSVGSSVGGTDIFNSDITSPIATGWGWTVPNLPDDGRTLYVRLSTLSGVRNALVGYNDYTYTASTTLPEITVFPGPTYLYANQLATGVTIPVSWSAPGYSSASLWCCSPGAWQDLDDVPTGSTTISLGQGITYFRLQTPAKDEQGTILVTATTTVLNVPVVGPSLVSSTSPCEGVQWVGEAGRYQMSPSSANVVLWAPLDNVQAGDTIEFFMLDQNFGILMNSTPTTLNVGGPGYCAWWTFQFAGTNLPAQAGLQAAVNINSQSLGVSAIAVGN